MALKNALISRDLFAGKKGGKILQGAVYLLALSATNTLAISTASAEISIHPLATCSRQGNGISGPWTCVIPTTNGGQALITGVPSEPGNPSQIDTATVAAWISANIGQNAVVLGDMTTTASGANSVAVGSGAKASTANSVALGAGSITEQAIGTSSATIAGQSYSFAGSAPVGTISVGSANNERTVTNVAAGRVSATSTDAVNGSQLYATNKAIDTLDNVAVKYDQNPDGTKSNTISLQGGDPGTPVVISNVAAGTKDTDAVNLAQLNAVLAGTSTQSYSYVDNRINNAFEGAKNYTDQRFSELSSTIDGVREDAHRSAAIGLAAASLRYDENPGKVSVAVGGGFWRGQSALAFGAGYTNDDSTIRANVSGTTSGGKLGVGAGLSFTLN
jgi:autotransporter adhesin